MHVAIIVRNQNAKAKQSSTPPDVITLDQVNRKSIEIEVETYLKLPLSIICSTWKFTFKQFFSVKVVYVYVFR